MVRVKDMPSIAAFLNHGERILASSGIGEPRREAISLLVAAIKREKAFVYAHPEYDLAPDESAILESFLERRARREPLQYILGVQEFYGLDFEVSPDVLIPRPETELLVEQALAIIDPHTTGSFCEIGIGSGCITVSILHHAKNSRATGLDVSPKAISIAERNAVKHGVRDRLTVLQSDVFDKVDDRFDLIVSNPPYISASQMDSLQPEVRDYEPRSALTDEHDGLSIIGRIVEQAPEHLSPKGFLLMEIGFDQSESVDRLFYPALWSTPAFFADLQGIRRVVSARLK